MLKKLIHERVNMTLIIMPISSLIQSVSNIFFNIFLFQLTLAISTSRFLTFACLVKPFASRFLAYWVFFGNNGLYQIMCAYKNWNLPKTVSSVLLHWSLIWFLLCFLSKTFLCSAPVTRSALCHLFSRAWHQCCFSEVYFVLFPVPWRSSRGDHKREIWWIPHPNQQLGLLRHGVECNRKLQEMSASI